MTWASVFIYLLALLDIKDLDEVGFSAEILS